MCVCVYIIIKTCVCVCVCVCVYVCMYVCGGCLNKYISAATWPLQTKIPGSTPTHRAPHHALDVCFLPLIWRWTPHV